VNENVLPSPNVLSTHIFPPCSTTNCFATASPIPIPAYVTQGTKRRTMVDFAQFMRMLVDEEYLTLKTSGWSWTISTLTKKSHFTRCSARRKRKGSEKDSGQD